MYVTDIATVVLLHLCLVTMCLVYVVLALLLIDPQLATSIAKMMDVEHVKQAGRPVPSLLLQVRA